MFRPESFKMGSQLHQVITDQNSKYIVIFIHHINQGRSQEFLFFFLGGGV